MSRGRIVLIAAGILIAAGALFLITRGFSGAAAAVPEPAATGAEDGGRAKGEKEEPLRWQSFIRPGEREAPPRPVLRVAQELPSPFDRLPSGGSGGVRSGGARRESRWENPGLRLEGIAAGARAVALLSGQAVRVGDTVSGYRVVRIGRSAVTLADPEGARYELSLPGNDPAAGEGR